MKIIHFGCWNNIVCDKEEKYNFRDIVLDYIKQYESDYKAVIISGDNWYTNEYIDNGKKYKMYFTNILYSGLYKLYELYKPVHIILGNHDEDIDNLEDTSGYKIDCMLKTEKFYIDLINNKKDLQVPTLEELQTVNTKTLSRLSTYLKTHKTNSRISSRKKLIQLYEAKEQVQYELIDGQLFIFLNTNIFKNKLMDITIIESYINQIHEIIAENRTKYIFVIGHLPITSLSVKHNNVIITTICKHKEICKLFIETLSAYHAIYLCADTHNFQIMKIANITQIVVGTGGALPDIINETQSNIIDYEFLNYKVSGYYHNSYGYSIISDDDDHIKVTYKHIIDDKNSLINKEYIYSILDNDIYTHNPKRSSMSKNFKSNIMKTNELKKSYCENLSEDFVVKSSSNSNKTNNIFCYRKVKNKNE
jgi:hypothetical protein